MGFNERKRVLLELPKLGFKQQSLVDLFTSYPNKAWGFEPSARKIAI
jgi:hypothetical protein